MPRFGELFCRALWLAMTGGCLTPLALAADLPLPLDSRAATLPAEASDTGSKTPAPEAIPAPESAPAAAVPDQESVPASVPALRAAEAQMPPAWAVTVWGGQMVDEELLNNGVNLDLFLLRGTPRQEGLLGLGLQRTLWQRGAFALFADANLIGHRAVGQQKGPFAGNQSYADPQTFLEGTLGIGFRVSPWKWLGLSVIEGLSATSEVPNYEQTYRKTSTSLLNYLAFEAEAVFATHWAAVFRIHHRSGLGGLFDGVTKGSNGYLGGLRYRF
jgi:hypothetical protein